MNSNPLVSVLMTAYNREKLIPDAIESVLNSTYQNWELIIVDDCSKDDTVKTAKIYEEKDDRIKVYINEKNLGDYANRNKAASYASGKYLKYLDADDIMYPCTLQIMVDAMEKNKVAAIAMSQNIIDDKLPYPILVYPPDVARTQFLKRGIIEVGPSAAIIRTDIFNQVGGFLDQKYIGDSALWMKIGFRFPVLLLQPSLIWWRIHDDQQIVHEKKDNKIMSVRYHLNKSFINDPETPLSNEERSLAIKKLNRRLVTNLYYLIFKKFDLASFFNLLRKSGISFVEFFKAIFH